MQSTSRAPRRRELSRILASGRRTEVAAQPTAAQSTAARSTRALTTAAIALLVAVVSTARASDDVLHRLPDEALGFVLAQNLQAVDAKASRLLSTFDVAIPSPVSLVKAVTGLGEGLDEQGSFLFALLPGGHPGLTPIPMLLLPVSDYARFVAPLKGDVSGEICRVTLLGEEILIAQDGPYALMMNVDHRALMDDLLQLPPEPVGHLAPLETWLKSTDLSVVVQPRGVAALLSLGSQGIANQQSAIAAEPADPELMELIQEARQSLQMAKSALNFMQSEVEMLAVGAAMDDQGNFSLSQRTVLTPKSAAATLQSPNTTEASSLQGYANLPMVLAGSCALSPAWVDVIADADRRLTEAFPEQFDMRGIDETGLDAVERSTRAALQGVSAISWFVEAPDPDRQIVSNVFFICHVDDAASYLQSLKQSFDLENQVSALPGAEMPFQWEGKEFAIAGADGYAWGFDLAAVAADPNVPQWDGILRRFCGDDGEFWIHALVVDAHRVLISLESADQLSQQLQRISQGEQGLLQESSIQAALKLLNPNATWKCLVNPRGYVALIERALGAFFAQLGGLAMTPDFPEFPACPPFAFSANVDSGQVELDVAVPSASLEALGDFVSDLKTEP